MAQQETRVKLITQVMKLKDTHPDLAAEFGDEAVFVRKGLVPEDLKIEEGERAIISYITTAAKDRDGEIVLPSGADLKHYRKNPVVLFGHNYQSLPIGKNLWIKADEKGLIAKTQYAKHDEAEKVYQYRKDGFPLAESIGFIPKKAYSKKYKGEGKYDWDEGTLLLLEQNYGLKANDLKDIWTVYTEWVLLEYSDVAVPANPEATELAKSKGLIPKTTVTIWENSRAGNATQTVTSDDPTPGQLEDLSSSSKNIMAGIKALEKAIGLLGVSMQEVMEKFKDAAKKDEIDLSFLAEEDEPELEFSLEDVKSIVDSAVLSSSKSSQEIDITAMVKESVNKMLGKVVEVEE